MADVVVVAELLSSSRVQVVCAACGAHVGLADWGGSGAALVHGKEGLAIQVRVKCNADIPLPGWTYNAQADQLLCPECSVGKEE